MTEPMNSLLVFTKNWGFVGRHKVFPDDVLPLVFAFLVDAQSICNIQRKGVKAIGEALKVNTSLTKIHLYGNNIGDEGGRQSERH